MNPIQFYTSVDVTLSEKLLEIMYCLIGLISMYVAFKNLKDKDSKSLDVIIGRLRVKIGDSSKSPKHIFSVRGIGYKLIG